MKIGYPCTNLSLDCSSAKTFRLASYTEERLQTTVQGNLECLLRILQFNLEQGLLFFRLSSDLVPFASHPICQFNWQDTFRPQFEKIGSFIRQNGMRVSMHPDQFTLINSLDEEIFQRSVAELEYHAQILDLCGLDNTHKIQIHVGGVYGDKAASITRFIERFFTLPQHIQRRLVIENDDRLYTVRDCHEIHQQTLIPILFDNFHHELANNGETIEEAFVLVRSTWAESDGVPMVDYSSQDPEKRRGSHVSSIDLDDFKSFVQRLSAYDFDVMLEIKDKECSALKAAVLLRELYNTEPL
jgi:UV DNA damage endonuclease